jgi:hypothetical protein
MPQRIGFTAIAVWRRLSLRAEGRNEAVLDRLIIRSSCVRSRQASDRNMDMGDLDPRLDACDSGFLVLRQLAASPEPGGPRYRPASRQDRNNTGASDRLSISIRHAPSPFSAARSLGQALPPSAKTSRGQGRLVRIECGAGGTLSRSCTLVGCTTAPTITPRVLVTIWRLRPLTNFSFGVLARPPAGARVAPHQIRADRRFPSF